jgi:hypothetical protein
MDKLTFIIRDKLGKIARLSLDCVPDAPLKKAFSMYVLFSSHIIYCVERAEWVKRIGSEDMLDRIQSMDMSRVNELEEAEPYGAMRNNRYGAYTTPTGFYVGRGIAQDEDTDIEDTDIEGPDAAAAEIDYRLATLVIEDKNGKLAKVYRPMFDLSKGRKPLIPQAVLRAAVNIYWVESQQWIKRSPNDDLPKTLSDWLASKHIHVGMSHVPEARAINPPHNTSGIRVVAAYEHKPSGFYCGVSYVEPKKHCDANCGGGK